MCECFAHATNRVVQERDAVAFPHGLCPGVQGLGFRVRGGRGAARAEYAQRTPTQSHIPPSILVYEEKICVCGGSKASLGALPGLARRRKNVGTQWRKGWKLECTFGPQRSRFVHGTHNTGDCTYCNLSSLIFRSISWDFPDTLDSSSRLGVCGSPLTFLSIRCILVDIRLWVGGISPSSCLV